MVVLFATSFCVVCRLAAKLLVIFIGAFGVSTLVQMGVCYQIFVNLLCVCVCVQSEIFM